MGSIFAIYKDTEEYCVHAGEEWNNNDEPLLGYYNIHLEWDELISNIAERYDDIRNNINKCN